ncbi:unnamed protein product [Rotaria magnacalcarata]|uniref:Uncharacterized protein n=1 Tax=Rotaria magnacalcarata TaxID=392030 RepID=A0A819VS49_9BILA|nr:unnamed protein product [Rotaria magnacalcarata]CAF4113479.1 unnamed protein product [Rotaria magnacalcarata]
MSSEQQQANHDHLSQSSKETLTKANVPLPPSANFLRCYVPITRCQINADILIPGRNDQENVDVQFHQG